MSLNLSLSAQPLSSLSLGGECLWEVVDHTEAARASRKLNRVESALPPDVRWWLSPTGSLAFLISGLCPRTAMGTAPEQTRNTAHGGA